MALKDPGDLMKLNHFGILGAGVTGKGAARLLLSLGKRVTIFDDKDRGREVAHWRLPSDAWSFVRPVTEWGQTLPKGGPEHEIDALIVSPGVPHSHPFRLAAERCA